MQISKKLVKIQSVINRLEEKGFTCELRHLHAQWTWHRGFTIFVIGNPQLDIFVRGEACCAPGDNYSKIEGTRIAFQRAIRKLSEELGPGALRQLIN